MALVDLDSVLFLPEWMRCPQWRWQTVMGSLANSSQPLSKLKNDPILSEGALFYRTRKGTNNNRAVCCKKFPDFSTALELYSSSRADGWRWFLEALLMTDASDKDIQKILKVKISPETIKTFRRLYFDIDSYRNSEIAVTANVMSVSKGGVADHNDFDFTWKLFAYTWGADAFAEQFCLRKQTHNKKYRDWFREVINERLSINSFHVTTDLRLAYNMQSLEVLKVAQDSWTIPPEAIKDAETIAQREFLGKLNGHIDLTLMNAKEKFSKVEMRNDIDFSKVQFH